MTVCLWSCLQLESTRRANRTWTVTIGTAACSAGCRTTVVYLTVMFVSFPTRCVFWSHHQPAVRLSVDRPLLLLFASLTVPVICLSASGHVCPSDGACSSTRACCCLLRLSCAAFTLFFGPLLQNVLRGSTSNHRHPPAKTAPRGLCRRLEVPPARV